MSQIIISIGLSKFPFHGKRQSLKKKNGLCDLALRDWMALLSPAVNDWGIGDISWHVHCAIHAHDLKGL